jgi:hypothetical protein
LSHHVVLHRRRRRRRQRQNRRLREVSLELREAQVVGPKVWTKTERKKDGESNAMSKLRTRLGGNVGKKS